MVSTDAMNRYRLGCNENDLAQLHIPLFYSDGDITLEPLAHCGDILDVRSISTTLVAFDKFLLGIGSITKACRGSGYIIFASDSILC